MSAATTTTITNVAILSKKRRRADVFDITLSSEGIDIKRPGKNEQHLRWDRISQWEIAEHAGFVVLTLRGDGAVTPLLVKGWTLDDLEVVMREVTSSVSGPIPARTMPPTSAPPEPTASPAAEAPDPPGVVPDRPEPPDLPHPPDLPDPPEAATTDTDSSPNAAWSPETRAARRQRMQHHRRGRWKPIVTIGLLAVLVAAVTLVLLQSAGVISWGFLGPTA